MGCCEMQNVLGKLICEKATEFSINSAERVGMDFFTSSTDAPFCKNNLAVSLSRSRTFLFAYSSTICVIASAPFLDSLK